MSCIESVPMNETEPAVWKGACVSQVLSELPEKVRAQIPESVRLKLASLVTEPTGVEIVRLQDDLLTAQQAYVICRGILNEIDPDKTRRAALSKEIVL